MENGNSLRKQPWFMDLEIYPGPDEHINDWSEYKTLANDLMTAAGNAFAEIVGVFASPIAALYEAQAKEAQKGAVMFANYQSQAVENTAELFDSFGKPDEANRLRKLNATSKVYPTSVQPWQRKRPRR